MCHVGTLANEADCLVFGANASAVVAFPALSSRNVLTAAVVLGATNESGGDGFGWGRWRFGQSLDGTGFLAFGAGFCHCDGGVSKWMARRVDYGDETED